MQTKQAAKPRPKTKPSAYITIGITSGVLGVLTLIGAHSGDDIKRAIYQAELASGGNPAAPSFFGVGDVIGIVLLLTAVVTVLIGIIGAGVAVGRRD